MPRSSKKYLRRSSFPAGKSHNKSTYRSGLEDKNAAYLKREKVKFTYETLKIQYTKPASDHVYHPDFIITTKSGKQIIVETKGIWPFKDRKKHLLVRQQHPELDIRFVFTRSKSKISKSSKTTYAMICDGLGRGVFKGVVWKYADKMIPAKWLEE